MNRINQRKWRHSTLTKPQPHAIAHAVAACCPEQRLPGRKAVGRTIGLCLAGALAVADPVSAATFTVTNTSDTGPGSLRRAVTSANGNPGLDDVEFSGVSGTITLNSGRIKIKDSVNIDGPGAESLTVDGNNSARIFYVSYEESSNDIKVLISGLTLTNSRVAAVDAAFCCYQNGVPATLTIEGLCHFRKLRRRRSGQQRVLSI